MTSFFDIGKALFLIENKVTVRSIVVDIIKARDRLSFKKNVYLF